MGWGGVETFLVIGAFFLTRKHLEQEPCGIKIGEAFLHRIKRIYPLYVTIIIVVVVVNVSLHHINADSLWYIFSFQNFRCFFDGAGHSLDSYLGHFWYIGLDLWLFLMWAIVLRVVKIQNMRKVFIITLIIGLLWRTVFILLKPDKPSFAYVVPFGQLDCWSIGGLVALNTREEKNRDKTMLAEIAIGILGILLVIGYNGRLNNCSYGEAYRLFQTAEGYMTNPLTGNIHFFIAVLSAGLLRYCLDTKKKHPVFSTSLLVSLGGMTYELYCFHYPIRSVVKPWIHNEIIVIVVTLFISYIASALWSRYISPVINRIIK